MRTCMNIIIVTGELLLFALIATAGLHGAERPTYVAAKQTAVSPYAVQQPTRVILTNTQGDETTLIYRRPAKLVDSTEELLPLEALPIVSRPARADDFAPTAPIRQASYSSYQANYSPPVITANQPIVPVANCGQPVVTSYPPATQYSMPGYNGPITGAPQVVYRPVAPMAPAPVAVQSNVQVGAGIYGQPVIYRQGQPVRNFWRWLTP